MSLKTPFLRGTSLKNCCRETAIFTYFTCLKIFKIWLSPAQELDFQGPGEPQIDPKSFEIQLGKQLGTKSDAKLAYDTEF